MDRHKLSVEDIFACFAEQIAGHENRPEQLELSHAIDRAFKNQTLGIFEAGTGIGKSLAALIPAALSGKRVVVSTNTISLQEQYVHKDIPVLAQVLPFELKTALMKGRGNYLGLRRWEEHLLEQEMDEKLLAWVHSTEYGDVSELDFIPGLDTWLEINSDSDDCLGQKCTHFSDCFYFDARRRAERADILVVNHALLLADAASYGSILPAYDLLVVDEAHHLPDVATDAFSSSVSLRSLQILGTKLLKKVFAPREMAQSMESEAHDFFQRLALACQGSRTRLREPVDGVLDLILALQILKRWLKEQEFEQVLDVDMARERAKLKAKALVSTIDKYISCLTLVSEPDDQWVVWAERSDSSYQRLQIIAAPLDVSAFINDLIINKKGLESSVWMSATLATGGEDPFAYFRRITGIDQHVMQAKIASPFNYASQALLYLPKGLVEPNNREFLQQAADEIERLLSISNGRAFVLFTSKAALNTVFDLLNDKLPYSCKKQGDMPRQRLIEWFKSTASAVLFGTASFWEGVSVDGEQLSCVIIDRIPFQVPDDPVYEARCEVLKSDPQASWFNDLALPYAAMRLKQGVGRLIRTHQDRGIVAILDPRLTTKYYGKHILECLPPMTITRSLNRINSLEEVFGGAEISIYG